MIARTSIQRKLMTAIMLTSTTTVLLVGLVMIAHDHVASRDWFVQALGTRARIVAANSGAALAFENAEDAHEGLSVLSSDPAMEAAALYDRRGRLVATYSRAAGSPAFPGVPGRAGAMFEGSHLVFFEPVITNGLWLGTLYLKSDLQALNRRTRVLMVVVLVATAGSLLVAFALSIWFRRHIAQPVRSLTNAAQRVSTGQDYSVRVTAGSDDELGVLAEAFNHMLGQVEQRDAALRAGGARMRAILESALDCIITMDHDGRIVEFNPAAEKLFGYARAEAIGQELAELIIPPGSREQHRRGLARYLVSGKSVVLQKRLELAAMRSDGSEMPVELAITRISQVDPPMFTGFIRDITESKRAEAEIQSLNAGLERRVVERTAELAAANKELEAFSYSVSHDMRAPLRAIDGFSRALLDDYGDVIDETGKGHIARVRGAARQMGQLIDDLLDLARLSRVEMQDQPVDVGAIAREVAVSLAHDQPERQVQFAYGDGLDTRGDRQLLRVVLDNLLRNAWKFTSKHPSARIEVGSVRDNGTPVFFVRDDGAGFDMAHADLLFTPFQRLHRQSEFEGTGVGLATVQRIIQRHRGRLWAEGAVEGGATFYFTLWEGAHA